MATTSVFRRREHPRDANGQFTRKKRPEAPDAVLAPPVSRQRVDEWVAWAQTHTVVEKIDSPPGFLADCAVAPGAITAWSKASTKCVSPTPTKATSEPNS